MNKTSVLWAATVAVLAVVTLPAFAQYPDGSNDQTVTKEQLEQCKELGIPEFTCTQQTILARLRYINANKPDAYGSGTSLFGNEMLPFLAGLGAIFGGVAVAFFAKSKIGKKVPI